MGGGAYADNRKRRKSTNKKKKSTAKSKFDRVDFLQSIGEIMRETASGGERIIINA